MLRNVTHRVDLPEDLDRFVRDEIAAGRFHDVDAAVRAALERLRDDVAQQATWRQAIEVGAAQADRGDVSDGDEAFARVRDRLRAKHGDVI